MWSIYKLSLIASLLWVGFVGAAQDVVLEERIEKQVVIDEKVVIDINNKYGDVIIQSWDKDSLLMVITKRVTAKDVSQAEKLLQLVTIDFWQTDRFVQIQTEFYEAKGWLGSLWKSTVESSRQLLGQQAMEINYEIYMPRDNVLKLRNRFGNVIVPTLSKPVDVDVEHGSLKMGEIPVNSQVHGAYGDVRIKSIADAQVHFTFADVTIDKAGRLTWQGKTNDVRIGDVEELHLVESLKDEFQIESIGQLRGNSTFSNLYITLCKGTIALNSKFGSLTVRQLSPYVSNVRLQGENVDYELLFPATDGYKLELTNAKPKGLRLPLDKVVMQEEIYLDDLTLVEAQLGNPNSTKTITIDTKSSYVSIGYVKM